MREDEGRGTASREVDWYLSTCSNRHRISVISVLCCTSSRPQWIRLPSDELTRAAYEGVSNDLHLLEPTSARQIFWLFVLRFGCLIGYPGGLGTSVRDLVNKKGEGRGDWSLGDCNKQA